MHPLIDHLASEVEKLRAAGIDFRALAKPPEQLGSFRDAFRFFQAESSEHLPVSF